MDKNLEFTLNIIKDNITETKNEIKLLKDNYNELNVKTSLIQNKINDLCLNFNEIKEKQKIINGYTKEKQKIIDTIMYFIRSPKKIFITSFSLSLLSIVSYISYFIINKIFTKLDILQKIIENIK